MARPAAFGQAIILLVYAPLLMFEGVEGKMFGPMAATVMLALLAAFILSFTFVPAMAALIVREPKAEAEAGEDVEKRSTDAMPNRLQVLSPSCDDEEPHSTTPAVPRAPATASVRGTERLPTEEHAAEPSAGMQACVLSA